ncbi:MAG: acyl-CoA thioesterase, partial [Anaerolineae bacterium]|nr:acyl-CoA thioesterase [Anaerolineae bacterium]
VRVLAENPITGEQVHTNTAYLVYVALDEEGNAVEVPALIAESPEEKERLRKAKERQKLRLAQKK